MTRDFLGLASALQTDGERDVRTDFTTRDAYSHDASLYRVVPSAEVLPRAADEMLATFAMCQSRGIALLSRGACTSAAGNAITTVKVDETSGNLGG